MRFCLHGTTLAVEASDSLTRIVVLEGLVEVRDLAGRSGFVPEGYAVRADREGLGPVERALMTDLDEGRRLLDRVRDLVEPPSAGGTPGLPAVAPRGAERRPTALERAEAAFDRARSREGGADTGPGRIPRDLAGTGTGARAEALSGAGPGARADNARADLRSPALGAEIRIQPGPPGDPAGRPEAGVRAEAGGRAETSPGSRVEAEVRTEVGVDASPRNADRPERGRKDPRPVEIDVRTRTDLPAEILSK